MASRRSSCRPVTDSDLLDLELAREVVRKAGEE
jgi:hypothetical protein